MVWACEPRGAAQSPQMQRGSSIATPPPRPSQSCEGFESVKWPAATGDEQGVLTPLPLLPAGSLPSCPVSRPERKGLPPTLNNLTQPK